ncbi:MAG: tRNA (adenosine(37)-N6)-threonylcarbamoyltransferase complex ATPase subunit type 1 TsaE [Aerococcus viridans]|nr:MAG: tRNA (adenosine(37)-N6)-threonylcarbamoyltransferase complex ATPase subunit type 1 TsaE [Aerococcus viridans]
MTYRIEWASEADTDAFAQKLATQVQAGDIICLEGNLGAGKTTFTKYFAKALGIDQAIKSPTYTIIREYEDNDIPLYHMDAYRLEETGSDSVGLEDYLNGDGVTIIEWPQFVVQDLPKDYLWLTLTTSSETSREVTLTYEGPRGQALYDEVVADLT